MITRKKPGTPPTQLADYVRLFNVAQVVDQADIDAMATDWQRISVKTWYAEAGQQALHLAEQHGRLTKQGIVTGELTDPDQGAIAGLADIVPGGGVVDVAIAVLVRDLLPAPAYRKLTTWWGKHPSTWLPDGDPTAAPEPPDEPAPPVQTPVQTPAQGRVKMPMQPQRRRTAADPAAAGAEPVRDDVTQETTVILPGKIDAPVSLTAAELPRPRGQTRAQAKPVATARDEVIEAARKRAITKTVRRRRAGYANFRGVLLLFGVVLCVAVIGDQLGPQLLPPADIASFGDGWGRLICAIVWVVIAGIVGHLSHVQFENAKTIRKGGR